MANEIRRLKREVNVLLSAIGQDFDDLPETVALSEYVWDDMTDEDIKEEAQEVFDTICYDNDLDTEEKDDDPLGFDSIGRERPEPNFSGPMYGTVGRRHPSHP